MDSETYGYYQKLKQELIEVDQQILSTPQPSTLELKAFQNFNLLKLEFSSQFQTDDLLDYWNIIDSVTSTRLFQVLKLMPKGALHHLHIGGILTPEDFLFLLKNDSEIHVKLFENKISFSPNFQETFIPIQEFLAIEGNESILLNAMKMTREKSVGTPDQRWLNFEQIFISTSAVFGEKRIWEKYLSLGLSQLYEENLQRVEFRSMIGIGEMNDRGESITIDEEVANLQKITDDFSREHPDFSCGLILTAHKLFPKQKTIDSAEKVFQFHTEKPEFVLGFDIVGEEDKYNPDEEVYESIYQLQKEKNSNCPMFFHSGEVISKNAPSLYDAILLDTQRIGHGIDLIKYPHLLEIVRNKKITIEVCPISNMVLGYVRDLRMHPALAYLYNGIQISISSDVPGLFGYKGVTHDWLWICMLWNLDLMLIKKIVENSIDGCTEPTKTRRVWEKKWEEFILYLAEL